MKKDIDKDIIRYFNQPFLLFVVVGVASGTEEIHQLLKHEIGIIGEMKKCKELLEEGTTPRNIAPLLGEGASPSFNSFAAADDFC